jgi:hypothetical protein
MLIYSSGLDAQQAEDKDPASQVNKKHKMDGKLEKQILKDEKAEIYMDRFQRDIERFRKVDN